jgi:hypothetical protein
MCCITCPNPVAPAASGASRRSAKKPPADASVLPEVPLLLKKQHLPGWMKVLAYALKYRHALSS